MSFRFSEIDTVLRQKLAKELGKPIIQLEEITTTLIELARTTEDESLVDKCIVSLQYRGTLEVLTQAQQLTQSENISDKFLGIEILGQLGIPKRTFPDECLNILLDLLKVETNPEVLCSVGISLGHLKDSRAVRSLIEFKNHPHSDVRYGVVLGLLTQEDPAAIATLIELSSDLDEDVRNWATFGLGSQIETDTEEIRESLWKRLREEKKDTETSYEIFCEALVGLATRKDLTISDILLEELTSEEVWSLAVEAAEELGHPKLYQFYSN